MKRIVFLILATAFVSGCVVPNYSLAVDKIGTGYGAVASSPEGIDCGTRCYALFQADREMSLVATPDEGSVFSMWGGDCSGTLPTCTLNITRNMSVLAYFEKDDTAPSVEVHYTLLFPESDHVGLLNATATDNILVSTINIYLDDRLVKACPIEAISGLCVYHNKFAEGRHTYYATAVDSVNNLGRDPVSGTKNFDIV